MKQFIAKIDNLSPEELARQFWGMDSDKQADFYSALEVISDGKLCLQTAWIVEAITQKHIKGDYAAANAFRTLHSHAEAYLEVYIDNIARRPFEVLA